MSLLDQDWRLFTETAAHEWLGWPVGDVSRRVATLFREAISQENARLWLSTTADADLRELLPQVDVPTLLLYRIGMPMDAGEARQIAALIPGAQLKTFLDGPASLYAGDTAAVVRSILAFLGDSTDPEAPSRLAPKQS